MTREKYRGTRKRGVTVSRGRGKHRKASCKAQRSVGSDREEIMGGSWNEKLRGIPGIETERKRGNTHAAMGGGQVKSDSL